MILTLKRAYKGSKYTIGHLYINDIFFCDTIEDIDRGLTQEMSEEEIKSKKKYGETAIPSGEYLVTLTISNRFKKVLPLINDVKGFEGIRIHSGNTQDDSLGCIIVGENKTVGGVINSRATMDKLMSILRPIYTNTEKIILKII